MLSSLVLTYCMVVQLKASLIGQFYCAVLSTISQLVLKTSVIGQFNCNAASLIGQLLLQHLRLVSFVVLSSLQLASLFWRPLSLVSLIVTRPLLLVSFVALSSLISQLVLKASVIGQFNCITASLIGQLSQHLRLVSLWGRRVIFYTRCPFSVNLLSEPLVWIFDSWLAKLLRKHLWLS
jgi:hypothetical protein